MQLNRIRNIYEIREKRNHHTKATNENQWTEPIHQADTFVYKTSENSFSFHLHSLTLLPLCFKAPDVAVEL